MADYKILVTTQYSENYAAQNEDWDGKTFSWKPKGGSQFTIDIDSDTRFILSTEDTKCCIEAVLAKQSNPHCKYELVDFEFVDGDIKDLTAQFDIEVENILK